MWSHVSEYTKLFSLAAGEAPEQQHLQVCPGRGCSRAGRIPCACSLLESLPPCSPRPGECAARTLPREPKAELQEGSSAGMLSRDCSAGMLSTDAQLMRSPIWSRGRWKGWSKQGQALPLCSSSRTRSAALWLCSWKGGSGKLA